jgi:hypothetical protein
VRLASQIVKTFPVTHSYEEKTMNTTTTKLIAMITIISVGLAAGTASADNDNKKNNNNNKKSGGFSIGFGGGSSSNPYWNFNNNHNKNYNVKKVYVQSSYANGKCFYPRHRMCFVLPGDTWVTICQREYGNVNLSKSVATYNGLSMNSQLFVGQQIRLPEIHPQGVLRASNAPMPAPFVPAVAPVVAQNFVAPATNAAQSTPVASPSQETEPAVPSVAVGSLIVLEGQTLGTDKGIVRLRFAEMALPVEVLEWTSTSAKVRLPQMELTGAMRGEIEVLRADGSLASKSAVQLTRAAESLAAANTTQAD